MRFFVQELEKTGYYAEHPERYAFMRTNAFSDVVGHPMYAATPKDLGGYFKIMNVDNGKKVYRKYRGCTIVEDSNVMLDYRTICELGLPKEPELRMVEVSQSNWWRFYFLNSDMGIRIPAWLAVLGFIGTILSLLLSYIF